jgi:hypothetical protein
VNDARAAADRPAAHTPARRRPDRRDRRLPGDNGRFGRDRRLRHDLRWHMPGRLVGTTPGRMDNNHRRPDRGPHDRRNEDRRILRQHDDGRRSARAWRRPDDGGRPGRRNRQYSLGAAWTGRRTRRRGNACACRRYCGSAWAQPRAGSGRPRGADLLPCHLRTLLSAVLQPLRRAGQVAVGIARQESLIRGDRVERHGRIPSHHFQPAIQDRAYL